MFLSKLRNIALGATLLVFASQTLVQAASRSEVSFLNAKLMYNFKQEKISAILSKPEGKGPFPAMVLLHTCAGMEAHVSHDWPKYLSSQGYVTLSADSFGSRNIDNCDGQSRNLLKRALQEITRDAYGALQYLSSLPYVDQKKIGVMGFSLGAYVINMNLIAPKVQRMVRFTFGNNFRAGIGFYGKCKSLKRIRAIPFSLIQIVGSEDVHAEDCADLNHQSVKVYIIEGAHHRFDGYTSGSARNSSGSNSVYSEQARDQSREITLNFLATEFAKSSGSSRRPGGPRMAGGGGKLTAVKAMTMMDKNKDRQISRNEFRGPPKRFKFLDTDGDGAISKDELEAGFGKPRARKNAPPKNPGQRLAARGQGRPENRKKILSESEIRKTVIGNTLNFNAPLNGKNMFVYFAADGSVLFKVVGGGKIIRKNWFIPTFPI
jgi:dienelactone hydrolase